MRVARRLAALVFVCALVCGMIVFISCDSGDDDDDNNNDSGDDDDDNGSSDLPTYLNQRPELLSWSSWSSHFDHADPIPWTQLGGFGIGNGRVFSMLATVPPLTTLRNTAGPHYQKYLRFFSDMVFTVYEDNSEIVWEQESCYRVRGSAVYLTHQQRGDLSVWFVFIAPKGKAMDDVLADRTLVSQIIVHNHGEIPTGVLNLKATSKLGKVKGNLIEEIILEDRRRMAAGFIWPEISSRETRSLTARLGVIEPGAEATARFQMSFAEEIDPVPFYLAAAQIGTDYMLDETLFSWSEFTEKGAKVFTENERFNDLMEGLSINIAAQQAILGGVSEMSEYSGTWLRDIYGPARFYPLIGRFEDYRRMLDYYWVAVLEKGRIGNSMDLDIELDPLPPQPDWENLPVMTGRQSAESPSYLILHYKQYLDATGDISPIEERYGMLRHALVHQNIREGCLLPFSDDETFRPAMMAAFGHNIFGDYQDRFLSANSSFLFVVAAQFLERVAIELGYTDHAEEYALLASQFRNCTEEHYWLENGFYAPILDIDTLDPIARPYEDVNTKPVWSGYLSPDDPKAEANLQAMIDILSHEEGLLYSPYDPMYDLLAGLLGLKQGIVTGMTYGYQLENFSRLDHPMAEESFSMWERFFHDTGNVSEGQSVGDFGRVAYLYEPFGFLVDLTGRYRSWEGGINGAAMLHYLFGLELHALSGKIEIAPHLPQGWQNARMEQARLVDTRFDISVEDEGDLRRVTVENLDGPLTVDAVVSVAGVIESVTVNGEEYSATIEEKWDRQKALLPGQTADEGDPLVIEVFYQ